MNREQLLWLQGWIALSGCVFWSLPPRLPHWEKIVLVSAVWTAVCLLSIFAEAIEDWAHRLSSFVGFLFCTIEGILGLLGFADKSGILLMSALHGCTFFLSVAGKYQSRLRRRPKRSMEAMAETALREIAEKEE